jgi:hypothetical protein
MAILLDKKEAGRLAGAGRTRAAAFSWTHAARATVDVYERTLAGA